AKNWATEIVKAIDACSTFLCLLSPHSLASHNVAKELHLASEKQKNILPVVLEKVKLPSNFEYSLAGLQRVQYEDRPAIFQALELLHDVPATDETPPPMERSGIGGGWGVVQSPKEDDSIHIAVLPFDDLSPDHDNQWFADGMMDELISTLGSLDRVKVPSRSDVLHYRKHHKKSREIARELGVRYLIEGGVRKANEKIRINASLTDTLPGVQLWTNKFDGSFDDVFAFQESVSKQITAALRLKLTPEEKEKIAEQPTRDAEAYELYLKAREQQSLLTREGYEKALELYEQAAKIDPDFTDARIAIASACDMYFREYSRDPKWLKRAEKSVEEVEKMLGETAKTLWIRGEIEWLRGHSEAAIAILTKATEIDPTFRNPYTILGTLHLTAGNFFEAAKAFRSYVNLHEDTFGYLNLLIVLNQFDDQEQLRDAANKALTVFERHLHLHPNDETAMVHYVFVLLCAGRRDDAAQLAEQLIQRNDLGGHALYNLGGLYDDLGKPELYIDLLRRSIAKGYREIEQTRNYVFTTRNEKCEQELREIIAELEETIRLKANKPS
ncbi:MAG: tetratricopeptide repeat protein, partial [Candidatus Kapaibacterium sp.]